ncbi:uncharacterized protein LTHEOB_12879 [Lasiodiplodia theobromae]|uniref:uncharacterized protein n=1 Tax=Lasiodiplodia theobromae TaxID=45133 RepID=UPI0015C386F4|nr:uncharacterized protein LTHEOB_12879 [Lasiodiplodia theobromae]KAF4534691.1 hypothetical protein LTHEOB_12879 [Lasiodiplodia theobromae]
MLAQFYAAILCFASISFAHSWVEDISSLDEDGNIAGDPGYPRGFVPRVIPVGSGFWPNDDFNDFTMQYLIPPNDREDRAIYLTDRICKSTQQTANQTDGYPVLQAKSGSTILLRYQENGHVTLLGNSTNRRSSGHIWVYGTADPADDDTLMAIHGRWSEDGTGGDHRGALLTDAPFDDGKCYQTNTSEESKRRRLLPQRSHTTLEGADLWCGTEVPLPDLDSGTQYALYWVWSFPTQFSDGRSIPEIYTTCIDVAIV